MHTIVIAEAGVNHNGDMNLAKKLIDEAKTAGADYVKFQTAVNPTSKYAPKAEYQKRETGADETQLQMALKLRLTLDQHYELYEYCNKVGIAYLSTAFDIDSVHFLDSLDLPFWKIPSGEITNLPYLLEIAKTHKPVVMSTGMAELDEIKTTIGILKENGSGDITLLQCHTDYPTMMENVNLRAMNTLADTFDLPVGLSDHSIGIEVPIAATAMGATVIEKHFTLDRNMYGPDHKASIEPEGLRAMISAIRNIEIALGDGKKECSPLERKNIIVARKSIVAKRDIKKGEVLTEENITTKRPGNGVSAMKWFDVLGTKAVRDFGEDELICLE
ncbi:MAG: N-acetylneuraminate synthase [Lachnospiraceae bacterium]|nr:N-acetylneuraminate synthase [Lachnospiraceae bacterium]